MPNTRNHSGKNSRTKPWVRARRIMLAVAFLAFVVPCMILVGLKVFSERNLEGHIASIRAEGYPAALEELAPWQEGILPAPAGEGEANATATELYLQAFETLDRANDPHPLDNLRDILIQLGQDGTLPAEKLQDIEKELAANTEALALLHQGAGLPPGKYQPDYAKGWEMELPHVPGTRRAFLLLRAEAVDATFKQEPERACTALLAAMALLRPLQQEPLLASQGARTACIELMLDILGNALKRLTFTEEQLARLQEAFQFTPVREGLSNVLVTERVLGIQAYAYPPLLATGDEDWRGGDDAAPLLEVSSSLGVFVPDRKRYFGGMEELIAGIRLPYPDARKIFDRVAERIDPRYRWRLETAPGQPRRRRHHHHAPLPSFSKMLVSYNNLPLMAAQNEAYLGQCAAAIALERYRVAQGTLPERLDLLAPAYLAAPPIDPFDLQPLRYLPKDQGYILYSVGLNGADDGGVPGENPGEGDLVFQVQR